MWIRPDVSPDNPNKWQIDAELKLMHQHLDDDKTYLVENGKIIELPVQMKLMEA